MDYHFNWKVNTHNIKQIFAGINANLKHKSFMKCFQLWSCESKLPSWLASHLIWNNKYLNFVFLSVEAVLCNAIKSYASNVIFVIMLVLNIAATEHNSLSIFKVPFVLSKVSQKEIVVSVWASIKTRLYPHKSRKVPRVLLVTSSLCFHCPLNKSPSASKRLDPTILLISLLTLLSLANGISCKISLEYAWKKNDMQGSRGN